MQSDLIEKFRWSLQTLNNSVNRTPVLKVVKQFFFFFCFWNEGWMTLHYVISVHTKFLLLGFSCLWVCGLEECFWLDRKACCTATKLKSSSLVTAVLAAVSWWYLTAVGLSGVCVPSALWMSSAWEGFPSFSRQSFRLFVNFAFCKQKCIWLFYQYSVLATDASVAT